MEDVLVSIIVPVYQAEKTLNRCLDSIAAQLERQIEVILIDDGSTDGSGALCDRRQERDGRFRVIHQANAGVSAARNAGIEAAQGLYLQFVDADDRLGPGYTHRMLEAAEYGKADVVIAGNQTASGGVSVSHMPPWEGPATAEMFAKDFERFYYPMLVNSPCNKLYRRSLIKKGFPLGILMGEDLMFNMAFLQQVSHVAVVQTDGYLYEQNQSGSACTRFSDYNPASMLAYCGCVRPFLDKWLTKRAADYVYDRLVFHSLCNNLNMLARLHRDDRDCLDGYLKNEGIRKSIRRAALAGFPKPKQIVGACLKLGLNGVAMAGIRKAAKR
ncbi:MAG: glycosyltransferase [Eubacteriales bacterium]|nr:glycosyltransferase [Eubacteriales bacterium]